ncbi:tetratricopeptide repeat protein [Neptunomonas sp.]|uniref:tetratricopeptide repeat protein n=1 Tax=Neptunomonas sp. TaxID=1971898 RepID=UPI0025E1B4A9|nr:tetratricopeptide repeat protein [Neptunomonas sp.]
MKRTIQHCSRITCAIIYLLFSFSVLASTESDSTRADLDHALDFFYKKNYDVAFDLFSKIASNDVPEALHYLGKIHAKRADFEKSMHLYKQAAQKNHIPAMRQIGSNYSSGTGVTKDHLVAEDWFRLAQKREREVGPTSTITFYNQQQEEVSFAQVLKQLEQQATAGEAGAQSRLAMIYDAGLLTPHSLPNAIKWYTLAAKNGNEHSQYMLGYFYCRGIGVEKDVTKANNWFKESDRDITCHQKARSAQ